MASRSPTPPPQAASPAPPAGGGGQAQPPLVIRERIGFLGAGQMAEALARGLIAKGVVRPGQLACTDPVQARRDLFASLGAASYATAAEVARCADVLVVAVKPQYAAPVLLELRPLLDASRHVIVSIAAGITLERLLDAAGSQARCVRVMPNTPCLVGETAAAMCLGGGATAADGALVGALFGAVGRIYQVDEKLLAAVTGLSGSGPAYVFLAIEALADGGVRAGLPRDVATALAAQTVLGSAKMVLETGKHPGALKDMVTSPGGTTIAGVHELEKGSVRAAFMNAVVAATQRANELSRMS
jgi:pyrroline-5-carboxylate reductase